MSCAFPSQPPERVELSDISGKLRFNEIARQAFIGGSVLYNPDQHYSTGTYQKITGSGNYRSARNIDDSDLTNVGMY
jgi:hypothetical protein